MGGVADDENKLVFDIWEFLEEFDEQNNILCDDKGNKLGEKISVYNM